MTGAGRLPRPNFNLKCEKYFTRMWKETCFLSARFFHSAVKLWLLNLSSLSKCYCSRFWLSAAAACSRLESTAETKASERRVGTFVTGLFAVEWAAGESQLCLLFFEASLFILSRSEINWKAHLLPHFCAYMLHPWKENVFSFVSVSVYVSTCFCVTLNSVKYHLANLPQPTSLIVVVTTAGSNF